MAPSDKSTTTTTNEKKKRGVFIVIEGLDRSGKSTQAEALAARLEESNVPAKLIKFPGQARLSLSSCSAFDSDSLLRVCSVGLSCARGFFLSSSGCSSSTQ